MSSKSDRARTSRIDPWVTGYAEDHQHPVNRVLHLIGIPLISVGVLAYPLPGRVRVALFVAGWSAQLIGHRIEGRKPSFSRDPRFMAAGAFWFVREIRDHARRAFGRSD